MCIYTYAQIHAYIYIYICTVYICMYLSMHMHLLLSKSIICISVRLQSCSCLCVPLGILLLFGTLHSVWVVALQHMCSISDPSCGVSPPSTIGTVLMTFSRVVCLPVSCINTSLFFPLPLSLFDSGLVSFSFTPKVTFFVYLSVKASLIQI